ncbi:MAG TPA: pyridoxal phosphate-dependent aminotransferase [Spirochaetota bacterium]|nr:pyridoxal phosphate-dependent aminotransferase [Spirochaetota bacterium]HPI89047.1 pyridoxal phosphate-dependent aminotransferase [Spirochaetota bacterium]HPR48660.1 pyridoxal phosphate-dependent aminotransferase [Spirochaetota bacterium]
MISSKVSDVKSFMVMDVMARAAEIERTGRKVIHLEVGEPDFSTPDVVREAAIEAIRKGDTHYTHAMGMIELREEICAYYSREYGVSITPEQVLVTSGTSPAMLLMMLAIVEPDDEVIVPNPHYACYPNFIQAVGGRMVQVRTMPEEGFQYRPEAIRKAITSRTRGIMINSPSNPTGIVMGDKNLEEIARFTGQYILSDEIYHGLVYEGRARSILEFTDRAFVINGFSKLFAMTGWRLGYLIFPPEFSSVMERMHQSFMISANSFVQSAGIAALSSAWPDVEKMKQTYNERRVYMIKRLREIGFTIHIEPTGAFYVYADAGAFCDDTYSEAFAILEKVGVGVTPGVDFGSGGERFIRFSYANSLENIREGLDRIEEYFKGR